MRKAVIALTIVAIVLTGVVVYQHLVITAMYQFIQAGCPFSQLQ